MSKCDCPGTVTLHGEVRGGIKVACDVLELVDLEDGKTGGAPPAV